MKKLSSILLLVCGLTVVAALHASPISSCTANFSSCNVYEDNMTLTLPGLAISGDVIIVSGTTVLDVFQINNDFVDTGGGTGLGMTAFLFAADLHDLPSPANYSVNAITIPVGPPVAGGFFETTYNGNGTAYNIFTPVPEPGTFALFGVAAGALLLRRRRASGAGNR